MGEDGAEVQVNTALTKDEAAALCEAHEVDVLFNDEEESGLLREHNPALWHAYRKLQKIADGQ